MARLPREDRTNRRIFTDGLPLFQDVCRPLPFLPTLINQFVTHVIARYSYGRKTIKRASQYGVDIKPLMN